MMAPGFGIVALLALPSQLLCPNGLFRPVKFLTFSHSQCPSCLQTFLPVADRWSYEFFTVIGKQTVGSLGFLVIFKTGER